MVNKLVAAAETDTAAEADGAWFEYNPRGDTPFRVKLARAGAANAAFTAAMEKRIRPFRVGVRNSDAKIPPEIARKIDVEVYANHVVKDWNAEDVGVPFSVDACIEAFKAAPDFLAWVMASSTNADSFRRQMIEDNAGN